MGRVWTFPLRLPTINDQVREFTRLGIEKNAQLGYDEDLHEDDFQDHLDDLPDEGLSPHEEPLDDGINYLYTLEVPNENTKNNNLGEGSTDVPNKEKQVEQTELDLLSKEQKSSDQA